MLPRSPDFVHASVVISELPALRRMPAPTPLPTLAQPGWLDRMGMWFGARRDVRRTPRRSAQVLILRA